MTDEVRIIERGIQGPPGGGLARARGRDGVVRSYSAEGAIPFAGARVGTDGVDLRRVLTSEFDTLADADVEAVIAAVPIAVDGEFTVSSPTSIASRLDFVSASGLLIVDGVDLTLSATFDASGQCFRCINGGRVLSSPGIHPYTDPAWFGAAGDGATDSTSALDAMHEFWVSVGGGQIRFSPGDYLVTHGYWARCAPGATRCHLILTGCTFKNTGTSFGHDFDGCPLSTNLAIFAVPQQPFANTFASPTLVFGELFETASAGDTTITLVGGGAADMTSFAAGKRVVLHGYATQNASWPPNERYFEFPTIESVDDGTGVITFTAPLQYNYDERWSDGFTLGPHGAPRVLSLDRDDFTWGEELIIDGGTFLHNPAWVPGNDKANGRLQITGYRKATIRNVMAPSIVPQMCDEVTFDNVHVYRNDAEGASGVLEYDKFIRHLEQNGGDIAQLENGFGVLNVLANGVLIRQFTGVGPRNSTWKDCEFHGNGNAAGTMVVYCADLWATQKVVFENCRADTSQVTPSANAGIVFGGTEYTFTVDSVSSATKVLIETLTQTAIQNLYRSLEIGRTAYTTGGNSCYVTAIYNEDATHVAVEGEFLSTPAPADVFRWNNIAELHADVRDIDPSRGILPIKGVATGRATGRSRNAAYRTLALSDRDLRRPASAAAQQDETVAINGRVTRVRLNVFRAYSGVDAAALLKIFDADTLGEINGDCSFSLKVAGCRDITQWWVANSLTGDSLAPLEVTRFRQLLIRTSAGTGNFHTYASPAQLPMFELVIETERPQ